MAIDLKGNKGFALVVVIVVMLLISFLASQLIFQVRTELKIASNRSDHIKERMLAEGGISLGLFRLQGELDLDTEELLGGPFRHGKSYETVFPEGKIEYYAVSELGKISLNATNLDLLMLFLEYHGLDFDERSIVAGSLIDWRDANDFYDLNGAEKDYYQELARPYSPRNGPIQDPAEFFMIRGTESLRGKFDPYEVFTVSHKNNTVNFNSLTPAMLDFLTQGSQEDKDLYWELREDTIVLQAPHAQQILGSERYAMLGNKLSFNLVNNPYYSIVATGSVGKAAGENGADDPEDGAEPDENVGKKKKGTSVKVLVSNSGGRIIYLSWRMSYT